MRMSEFTDSLWSEDRWAWISAPPTRGYRVVGSGEEERAYCSSKLMFTV